MPKTDVTEVFKDVDPTKLGKVLQEYIGECSHSGWDGWTNKQIDVIDKFLADVKLAYDNMEV